MSAPEPPPKSDSLNVAAINDSLPARPDPEASAAALAERATLQNELLKTQNELLKTEVQDRQQDRRERLKYADRIFRLIV